jgi:hypothetical protein
LENCNIFSVAAAAKGYGKTKDGELSITLYTIYTFDKGERFMQVVKQWGSLLD